MPKNAVVAKCGAEFTIAIEVQGEYRYAVFKLGSSYWLGRRFVLLQF